MVDEYDFEKGEAEFKPPEAATKEEFQRYALELANCSGAVNGEYRVSAFNLPGKKIEVSYSEIPENNNEDQLPIAITHITEQAEKGRSIHSIWSIYRDPERTVTQQIYTEPRLLNEKPIQEVKPTDLALHEHNDELKTLHAAIVLKEKYK